jgi:hypothetical protein
MISLKEAWFGYWLPGFLTGIGIGMIIVTIIMDWGSP